MIKQVFLQCNVLGKSDVTLERFQVQMLYQMPKENNKQYKYIVHFRCAVKIPSSHNKIPDGQILDVFFQK